MDRELFERMVAIEGEHWWFLGRGAIVRSLVESECARRPARVGRLVDVGTGTGSVLERLTGFAEEAIGVEPDPAALEIARGRGLDVRESGLDALPFADGSVDVVTVFDVLEHLDDDVAAAKEIRRVLAPGGAAVVTVPAYPFLWGEHDVWHAHKRRYTRRTLARTLRAAGLEVRRSGYFMTALFPLALLDRLLRRRTRSLAVPPRALNALLLRILLAERRRVVAGGFPFGLTVFAVAARVEAA